MASKTNKDLIIEILLRLPVKSLIRLKCVCKYWSTLIRDFNFISMHFHHPSNIDHLFVQHYDYSTEKYTFALFPDETLANSWVDYHNLGDLQMPNQPGILGIFHGIIGLWDCNRIVLWNPAIREFRVLIIPIPDLPPDYYIFKHFAGFGLDPNTNNYKVVWIWEYGDEEYDLRRVVAVYNLYADSWRVFKVDLPSNIVHDLSSNTYMDGCIHDSSSNTYLNGFYYWMADYNYLITILTFDMDKEIFGDIPGPPLTKYNYGDIVLHNNSITLIHWDLRDVEKCLDIWVMKEERFWTKELTIGPLLDVDRPLGLWKNGEVFLETNTSELVLYNCYTQEMKVFQNRGNHDDLRTFIHDALKTFIYKKSLVSVKRANECHEGNNVFNMALIQDFFPSLYFVLYATHLRGSGGFFGGQITDSRSSHSAATLLALKVSEIVDERILVRIASKVRWSKELALRDFFLKILIFLSIQML
ncbi:F-box/kelch-repeat protein At3g23880-like [Cornus florida]|uniref:F-box/kelch-repeat protein At3g23880-like n=1 Tax=Cornus florida TaxID=4283 RepID=UPI002898A8AF|nr:F-box/kelch-repeat protein At3g23880-like [Cornus florida]